MRYGNGRRGVLRLCSSDRLLLPVFKDPSNQNDRLIQRDFPFRFQCVWSSSRDLTWWRTEIVSSACAPFYSGLRTSPTQSTREDEWLFALNLLAFASCFSEFKPTTTVYTTDHGEAHRAIHGWLWAGIYHSVTVRLRSRARTHLLSPSKVTPSHAPEHLGQGQPLASRSCQALCCVCSTDSAVSVARGWKGRIAFQL